MSLSRARVFSREERVYQREGLLYKAAGRERRSRARERERKKRAVFSESNNNKERERERASSSSIMGGRVPEHRGEERTARLATKNKDDCVENGDRRHIYIYIYMRNDDADGESTFHYLSSIVVSNNALTGAVIGVESVWQRCKSGNCNPGSFLLPGESRGKRRVDFLFELWCLESFCARLNRSSSSSSSSSNPEDILNQN